MPKHVVVPYVENTLHSTNKYSCVRWVHTLHVSYFILQCVFKSCPSVMFLACTHNSFLWNSVHFQSVNLFLFSLCGQTFNLIYFQISSVFQFTVSVHAACQEFENGILLNPILPDRTSSWTEVLGKSKNVFCFYTPSYGSASPLCSVIKFDRSLFRV